MLGLDHNAVLAPLSPQAAEPAPALPAGTLAAEGVPAAQKNTTPPLIKILMPVVMLAAVGAMVAIMVLSGRGMSPMMMLFPLMMVFGVLMMLSPPDKTSDIDETRRVYLRHLDALAARARANADKQRAHAVYFHPDPALLLTATPTWRVWERGADAQRAGEVRIGVGESALCTPIDVADPGSPEDLDPVCAVSLRRTVAAVGTVPGMPIVVQLSAFPTLTLAGPSALGVARALVAQLAFFHGPEAIGVINRHPDTSLAWTKWLPHTAAPEAAWLTVVLTDAAGAHAALADPAADCVIVIDADPAYVVDEDAFNLACTSEVRARTEAGEELLGTPDTLSAAEALLIARHLAFYRRPVEANATVASGLLDMLGIADIDHLDDHTMWAGREGTRQRLTVPFGLGPDGQPVYLDLKEAAHGGMGPHGLCIGATGSGKSEFLRTLVVALAATHSPEELNLVLVDFKGGATFLGCEGLPHTSAVITNLEEEALLVERMHDAISGELNRRQELLRAAGNFANITDYAAARAQNPGEMEALPALVIVVDEFSELLSQHPHFADLFVAVGRLGRSLGVHLLLASQRLEEGRLRGLDSHLSYRIGLKTFSAAESRQVLGVPDAHELPAEPGSGFLATGPGALTRFRAAYVSGPVTRRVELQEPGEGPRIQLFDGWPNATQPAPAAQEIVDHSTTVLSAVVAAAARTARARGLWAHTVWLPPLPASIELAAVCEEAGFLGAVIGLTDEPYKQRQDHLTVDLSAAGGHLAIVGGPQTGKSMALTTLVASLAATHTTEQITVYAIDAGAGLLTGLEVLPHVAGVAARDNEEKVRRVVDEVAGFIDDPAALGGRHAIFIVDGWHAIAGTDSPLADLREKLTRIAEDGPAAGVHLVVTAQRWSAVRATIRDLIGTRLELRLTEPHDSLIDRKAQASLPHKPGRGLSHTGVPMLVAATYPQDLAHIAARSADQAPVPRLKVLPAHVTTRTLLDALPAGALPLGVGGPRLEPVACASGHVLALGTGGCGKSTLVASAIEAVCALPREKARLVILDPRRTHLGRAPEEMVAAYAAGSSAAGEAVAAAATTLSQRLPGPGVTAEQLAQRSWWQGPDIWLIIDDLDLLSEDVLRPLIPLVPHARDVGLHIVAARKFSGVARALYGGFLGAFKDLAPDALLFDATRDEGTIFGVRPSAHKPGRATLVRGSEVVGTVHIAAPYAEGEAL
ncbi:type VII secretion protein EccCa [Corynebacterium auris]|uniref:type VII secretion protein EccCa n=1 Tax=Corynebacterium auris TaxID=44750 RepID=UPI0025B3B7AC|nr:type VII secretion protein EccCa [Corynebacterium auris]WJY67362.1 ESX-1 secretion system protein EccCa1 [Corynebacterium auris]